MDDSINETAKAGSSSVQLSGNENEYMLVNSNEEIVKDLVTRLLSLTDNICKCVKCYNDICAIMLNNMQPHYSTTRKGMILSQLPQMDMMNIAEMNVIAARAIKIVSESPRH